MKEIAGKIKSKSNPFPKRLKTEHALIEDEKKMAGEFNIFFTNIGPKLAQKIPDINKSFEDYVYRNNSMIEDNELSFDEFEKAFKSIQRNKAAGYDDITSNIIIDVYHEIKYPLYEVFKCSIQEGKFPDKLKIAKVTPSFKSGDSSSLGNYRPISVLPVFSKILEKIMYNRVYSFLSEGKLLYKKQFGFQKNTSTEHAILQLIDDITKAFSDGKYTLGVFIDLSKAFDTVNHEILLKKMDLYGVRGISKKWFESYLKNRKQFVNSSDKINTTFLEIQCGVPQGSILGPLLFLIYVNDLCKASPEISTLMFADDSNLFLSHKSIDALFTTMKSELEKVSEWFKANKLSLNTGKTKFSLFHPIRKRKAIPNNLPKLYIDNIEIKRDYITKFIFI